MDYKDTAIRSEGLVRREFLKLGLISYLVAGIPTGMIPATNVPNAFARVGSNSRGIVPPTLTELEDIAKDCHMNLNQADLMVFQEMIDAALVSYRRINELEEPKLPVKYARKRGYRPSPNDNPLNAWYWKCSIRGKATGKLAGKQIAIKDNICVAGIPMMNGSSLLEGFVPDIDATVVTRILDAGGKISGKAVCEDLCCSGGSITSATGPVLNPHNHGFSAGGSSSGCAALVVSGACDMAIGGDQAGSIRHPSSWSGAYGLKPTYGLVPYTGIFPIEETLDHTGPLAMTVKDVALLLEVVAGKDLFDPRQGNVITKSYVAALTGNIKGVKLGIVREGFGWENASQKDVDSSVQQAANEFKKLGALVEEISIPMHRDGLHIWSAIVTEGAVSEMLVHNGMGSNRPGYYDTCLLDYFAKARRTLADNFPDTVKFIVLLGKYMAKKYYGRYYAKAHNLVPNLRKAYDDALNKVDILIMPTTPMKAPPILKDPSTAEYFAATLGMIHANTCPFNCTHHPAINVPCAKSEGLPVGMMLIGRHFEDDLVLNVAHAFERARIYQ